MAHKPKVEPTVEPKADGPEEPMPTPPGLPAEPDSPGPPRAPPKNLDGGSGRSAAPPESAPSGGDVPDARPSGAAGSESAPSRGDDLLPEKLLNFLQAEHGMKQHPKPLSENPRCATGP